MTANSIESTDGNVRRRKTIELPSTSNVRIGILFLFFFICLITPMCEGY